MPLNIASEGVSQMSVLVNDAITPNIAKYDDQLELRLTRSAMMMTMAVKATIISGSMYNQFKLA